MLDSDEQRLEYLLRMALADVCIEEYEDAIDVLAEAYRLITGKL